MKATYEQTIFYYDQPTVALATLDDKHYENYVILALHDDGGTYIGALCTNEEIERFLYAECDLLSLFFGKQAYRCELNGIDVNMEPWQGEPSADDLPDAGLFYMK